jgi:DNA replication protein DnaC
LQEVSRFLSMNDVFKDTVRRFVPELAEREDFETDYRSELECPKCGKDEGSGLYYRFKGEAEWIPVGGLVKCSSCRDSEVFADYQTQSLHEQKEDIKERLMKEYFIIPDELKEAGFKNYKTIDGITEQAKKKTTDYVKSFLSGPEGRHSLLISGSVGSGKSHLCAAIARTIRSHGFSVGFLTTGQVLQKIKTTYQKGASKKEEDIFRELGKLDLLILDDIGSEAIGSGKEKSENWRMSMLFEIVNSRMGKPTIYTSNLVEADLTKAVGERVDSRLYSNTDFLDMFSEIDYRKEYLKKSV